MILIIPQNPCFLSINKFNSINSINSINSNYLFNLFAYLTILYKFPGKHLTNPLNSISSKRDDILLMGFSS